MADRDTALIARPEKRNTTAAPMSRPTRFFGSDTLRIVSSDSVDPALTSAVDTVSV